MKESQLRQCYEKKLQEDATGVTLGSSYMPSLKQTEDKSEVEKKNDKVQ